MGVLADFIKNKQQRGSGRSTYGLTNLGKTKAEQYSSSTPRSLVMASLNENGVSTANEIAEDLHVPPTKIERILRDLQRDGYVRKVNQEG